MRKKSKLSTVMKIHYNAFQNREKNKNVKDKVKQLRFFNDILFDKQLNKINEMIEENQPQSEIEKYQELEPLEIKYSRNEAPFIFSEDKKI